MSLNLHPYNGIRAEADAVSDLLSDIGGYDWSQPTPADGWSIKHQVAHLVNVYGLAAMACAQPDHFRAFVKNLSSNFAQNVEDAMRPLLALGNEELLKRWEEAVDEAIAALHLHDRQERVPWLVNDIPAGVLAMAGLTEAFAHGQDIRDAVGATRTPTPDLYHICEFAYHTRMFGYEARGLDAPADSSLCFELTSPSGARWLIGDRSSANVVIGDASDLALLVTRRRHRDDLGLRGTTRLADGWLSIAQAYRGQPGRDRSAGQFAARVA